MRMPDTALHRWDVNPDEAIALQRALAQQAREGEPLALGDIHSIAGIDASYREVGVAAVVVLSYPALDLIEKVVAEHSSDFPYTPGLLSFREGPAVLRALERLTTEPDLLMFDGQGYAHPRRLGLATHLGLYLNRPSIGCAKSRLVGTYDEPGPALGDTAPLMDRGEVIGMALRSKPRTNPLFISSGYRFDLASAVAVTVACLRGYRMPEPTRLADRLTKKELA